MAIKSYENKELTNQKWVSLTKRERELLQYLAKGANNEAIANSLTISIKTVEFHVSNILRKLGMKSRAEIIAWVFRQYQPDISKEIKD